MCSVNLILVNHQHPKLDQIVQIAVHVSLVLPVMPTLVVVVLLTVCL